MDTNRAPSSLVIEGCFDLLHDDHRAFIDRCIERFVSIYGYIPSLRIRVMANEWAHRKGVRRPFMDVQDRIEEVSRYLGSYADIEVVEAARASFEYEDKDAFEKEFHAAIVAISKENVPRMSFQHERYLIIPPLNRFHTTDIEKQLLSLKESSHCAVRKVAALVITDGCIISQSANACSCAIDENCLACNAFLAGRIAESRVKGCREPHAEVLALSALNKHKTYRNLVLISTTAPCTECAKYAVDTGVTDLVYFDEWERRSLDGSGSYVEMSGITLLRDHGVRVRKAGC